MARERVALRRGGEGLQGNNKWLFFKLDRGNVLEAPLDAKRLNLEARLADVDLYVASGVLKEGVSWLVAGQTKALEEVKNFTAANVVLCRARRWTRSCQICWCLSVDIIKS